MFYLILFLDVQSSFFDIEGEVCNVWTASITKQKYNDPI